MADEKTVLNLRGCELEIDPRDFARIDAWSIDELRGIMFELMESTVKVTIRRGDTRIRGIVRFLTPTPTELKTARLSTQGKSN